MFKKYLILLLGVSTLISCTKDNNVTPITSKNERTKAPYYIIPKNVIDIDGNVYRTVVIGTQIWMLENLRVTHYRNGDPIQYVPDSLNWINPSAGAWCYYDNNSINNLPHGKLYNGNSVLDPRNIAPIGWHVPSESDWNKLIKYLDPNADTSIAAETQSQIAGMSLRQEFRALYSGFRLDQNSDFYHQGLAGYWWSKDSTNLYYHQITNINYSESRYILSGSEINCGFSIRCIKD